MGLAQRSGQVALGTALAFSLSFAVPPETSTPGPPPADVARSSPRPPDPRGDTIDSLGRRGQLREAIEMARLELTALERRGEEPASMVRAGIRLGGLLTAQGEIRQAIEVLERARERADRGSRVSREDRAAVRLALGRAQKNGGLYDASAANYAEALDLARGAGRTGLELEARVLISTAHLIRRDATERPRAIELLERALQILEDLPHPRGEDLTSARSGLALVLLQTGNAVRAESLLAHSVSETVATLGDANPDVGLAHSLWGWSQYLLGRYHEAEVSFRAAMATYDRAREQIDPGPGRRRVLHRVAVNLAGALLLQGRGDEAWAAFESGLSSYLVERLDPEAAPRTAPGSLAAATRQLRRVQRVLGARRAVIGWVEVNLVNEPARDVWGFVIRNHGPVRWVRCASPNPDPSVYTPSMSMHEILCRDSAWPTRVFEVDEATAAGHAAWVERMAPLEPYLDGVEHLVALNAWSSWTVPLEVMVDGQGRMLVDRFDVAYPPSAGALLALRDRVLSRRERASGSALLVGDPGGGPESDPAVPVLPESNAELDRIAAALPQASLLPGSPVRGLRRLSEADSLVGFDFLHFATHATADPRAEGGGMLVLDAAADGPGSITAAEIETWRLRARLVTLSGCLTSGRHRFGTSPGLAESFLVAGAAGAVVSLWNADDRAAALVMGRFYRNLLPHRADGAATAVRSESDPAEALREAKAWLRDFVDERGRKPFRNPAYWAGFVYIGPHWNDDDAWVGARR